MFQIQLTKEAQKDLKKLEKKKIEIVLKKLYSIREDPSHYIERLIGKTLWKLRIGDYRVILQLNTKDKKINVIKIGHRDKIYKRLDKLAKK